MSKSPTSLASAPQLETLHEGEISEVVLHAKHLEEMVVCEDPAPGSAEEYDRAAAIAARKEEAKTRSEEHNVWTPVTIRSRMPSSAWKKKKKKTQNKSKK